MPWDALGCPRALRASGHSGHPILLSRLGSVCQIFPGSSRAAQGSLGDPRQTPQYLKIVIILLLNRKFISFNALTGFRCLKPSQSISKHFKASQNISVRGRSTSSDVSSDISPSPLYIPPHRRQPKTECTRGSDTGVR